MHWLIVTGIIGVGATLFLADQDNDEPPPPPAAVAAETSSLEHLSGALRWLGGCSVVCSLIWGSSIVYTANLRRRESYGTYR